MIKAIWDRHAIVKDIDLQDRLLARTKPRFFMVDAEQKEHAAPAHRRVTGLARELKDRYEECNCEVCGWTPPPAVKKMFLDWRSILHAHHVVPRSCGGPDVKENIIIVCPICHALAHRLGRIVRVKKGLREWSGQRTKVGAIAEIRELLNATTDATTKPSDLQTA